MQVTYGCGHNGAPFAICTTTSTAIRPMEEVRRTSEMARRVYKKVEQVFLADGDAPDAENGGTEPNSGPDLRSVPGVPAGDVLRLAHQSPDQKLRRTCACCGLRA